MIDQPEDSERDLPNAVRPDEVLEPEDPQELPTEVVISQSQYAGPLPHEQWFEAVERVHQGATELILQDYRDQREHERHMEEESLAFDRESFRAFARYQTFRLVIVGVLATLLTCGGIVLAVAGEPLWGLAVLVAEIAGLVLAFYGVRNRTQGGEEESPAPED